jgi:hypothetical protein
VDVGFLFIFIFSNQIKMNCRLAFSFLLILLSCNKKPESEEAVKFNQKYDLYELRIVNMDIVQLKRSISPRELLQNPNLSEEILKTTNVTISYGYDNKCDSASKATGCIERIFGQITVNRDIKIPIIWYQINQGDNFYDVTIDLPLRCANARFVLLRNGEIIDNKSQDFKNQKVVRIMRDEHGRFN